MLNLPERSQFGCQIPKNNMASGALMRRAAGGGLQVARQILVVAGYFGSQLSVNASERGVRQRKAEQNESKDSARIGGSCADCAGLGSS